MIYTAMWRETSFYLDYRIQTNDADVAKKLRRRNTANLAGYAINAKLWIFRLQYASPKLAKQGLIRICGTKYGLLKKDASTGGFIAYTRTILIPKSRLESGKV